MIWPLYHLRLGHGVMVFNFFILVCDKVEEILLALLDELCGFLVDLFNLCFLLRDGLLISLDFLSPLGIYFFKKRLNTLKGEVDVERSGFLLLIIALE